MKKLIITIGFILTVIGLIAGVEAEIEWTVYLSIPLAIIFGAAGMAFFQRRIEAIIGGMIIGALLPTILAQLF
jgi:hypothetical protein